MRGFGKLDFHEIGKKSRRIFDGNYLSRKFVLIIILCGGILLYFGPSLAHWLFADRNEHSQVYEESCMKEKVTKFYSDAIEYNANILHQPPLDNEYNYLPYVGNGMYGIPISLNSLLYIRYGRTISLPVKWQPLILVSIPRESYYEEITVTHFITGVVYKYQCFREGYNVDYQYYAHRVLDNIFVQSVQISNPFAFSQEVAFIAQSTVYWSESTTERVRIMVDDINHEYSSTVGYVSPADSDKVIAVSILSKPVPETVTIKPRTTLNFEFLSSILYTDTITLEQYNTEKEAIKKKNIANIREALTRQKHGLKESHVNMWKNYWHSGFAISDSKAKGSINGHKINSTMYYILSQVSNGISGLEKSLINNEGCYRGHHTLDAPRLWEDTSTIENINEIVKAWFITLEKQGCHHLMTGNPAAVQQAIILSLGSLRFSNQHLEFNIDPQYLHRDYFFRRINYGNTTHLNISVTVNEDNRAVLGVALDRSDTVYYGCDAGCLDAPVSLSQSYTNFPVKLTKPLTAILYITSDYQHMQDLRDALHVHHIDEAPAHDHHVMALHKHGHQLGGLPTFFWVIICFLIIVFHLFLCKLIITEFCEHQDRQKVRYSKL